MNTSEELNTKLVLKQVQVVYGSQVKLEHCGTKTRLHSHPHMYSGGSYQQQVTGFVGTDENDWWEIKLCHEQIGADITRRVVQDGDMIRLEHCATKANLHSHSIQSSQTGQQEVSCFKVDSGGDINDNWQLKMDCPGLHDLVVRGMRFRLIHVETGGSLHSHDIQDDKCFGQNEVTCFFGRDENDLFEISEQNFVL